MKKTIGILAHVDGGKTTFSEQLLFHTGVVRSPGRVDQKNTVLDANEVERARGITIFTDQSPFLYNGNTYYLMDTPGHVDFSAETERAVMALDYAILLIDLSTGVTAHTVTLFKLLEAYRIPVFFFLNKTDLDHADVDGAMKSIREKLTGEVCLVQDEEIRLLGKCARDPSICLKEIQENGLAEFAAERNEKLLDAYMEDKVEGRQLLETMRELIKAREAFICMKGSALKGQGIKEFLDCFDALTVTDYQEEQPFLGMVYKIRHEENGNRVTFIKILKGTLRVKDELHFPGGTGEEREIVEKINEIRSYCGPKYTAMAGNQASAGDLIAVTGLTCPGCGAVIGQRYETGTYRMVSSLKAQVVSQEHQDVHALLSYFRRLEAEDPQLQTEVQEDGGLCVQVMGKIQLEVLKQMFPSRFGVEVDFLPPEVMYRETIKTPVMGYGHYEPLRHYAEVNLKLEPAPRGNGISFESQCHVDALAANYQKLVETHVFEKAHRGILTGAPLTDVKIILVAGRAHIKHTEGGDFREATYRAIRQGLEKADNLLLEPYYRFEIIADQEYAGKIMADIQKRSGAFLPPWQAGNTVSICGRGPVSEFMDYGVKLKSMTRGAGSISMMADGYDQCHNQEEVIARKAYDKGADKANPSSSVFCSHGAGFLVTWDQAEEYMHCLKG